ncbi:hypothetical protein GCM10025794_15290 [Massilia kyonggiensis]|nr:hypothetical protein [Massilia kyonggiensis]
MKVHFAWFAGACALLCSAQAADTKETGRYLAKPLNGDYYVYGGSIEDKTAPTQADRKLSLMLTGPLAKELFDQIGPDAKHACSSGPDYRERNRGDLACTWTKDQGYSCYVGLNVHTGKSMPGTTC